MVYSFIGLGRPIAAVNNILKSRLGAGYQSEFDEQTLVPGGIYATDISVAAAFAGENNMCLYLSIEELLEKSDLIFMFLSDKALGKIALTLSKYILKGKIFCHFSPAHTAEIMDFSSGNTYVSMIIPYFSKDDTGNTIFERIIAEGYGKRMSDIKSIFSSLGICVSTVTPEERLAYLTAVNFARDMSVVLKSTAGRLMKYALASHEELAEDINFIMAQTPSELSTYNPVISRDVEYVSKQCELLKSIGISDITALFGALVTSYAGSFMPNDAAEEIANIIQKNMKQELL